MACLVPFVPRGGKGPAGSWRPGDVSLVSLLTAVERLVGAGVVIRVGWEGPASGAAPSVEPVPEGEGRRLGPIRSFHRSREERGALAVRQLTHFRIRFGSEQGRRADS